MKTDAIYAKSRSFIIEGDPVPLARHRHGHGHTWDAQKQLKLGMGLQLSNQNNDQPLLSGPLKLTIIFYMPIPKHGSKKLHHTPHFVRPDLDNMVKMICDVANGVIYKDDSAISEIHAEKHYSNLPRTEFTISELRTK
jgi:Holliday junction resolvase RusA-like endonuclease